MPTDSLAPDIRAELKKWSMNTRLYGGLYIAIRTFLIVASALVAAGETLNSSNAAFLSGWAPVLAVLVTILTALDTWMKPRDKWRGFMDDRDDLDDLRLRVEAASPQQLDALRTEFANIRKRHREKNVY